MPLVLLRLESRARRVLVSALVLAGAAWMAKAIVSPAVAEVLADRAVTVVDLERAIAWDPGNPDLHLRLADAYESAFEGADREQARRHAETALRLRPTHSGTWLRLALLADAQGQRERAREALETALRYDSHNVSLRWEAAPLYMRWGERGPAIQHLRYVIEVDPDQRDAAFQVARSLLGPGEPPAGLLPASAESLTGLLESAIRDRDLDLARAAWGRRVSLAPLVPIDLYRSYLELLLEKNQGAEARRIWLAMSGTVEAGGTENLVWNGGFEYSQFLNWGLDWRVQQTWGVEVRIDRSASVQGRQSLRLAFNSFPSLDYAGVSQLVAVEPGRQYQLRAFVRAHDFVTRSGLKLQVVTSDREQLLAETEAVAGTTDEWVRLEARLQVPAEVRLVRVRLRRERAPGPEGNLGGKVWVDDVRLAPAGGKGA
jgi:tetratricopeptide (TPR) repeat protein